MAIRAKSVELLEKILENKPPEVQAHTWKLINLYEVDIAEEFFVIIVAIGDFTYLVETAPEQWNALFEKYYQRLELWSVENLKTLESITAQTQALNELIHSLQKLDSSTSNLQSRLYTLERKLDDSQSQLQVLKWDTNGLSQDIKTVLKNQEAISLRLTANENQNQKDSKSLSNQQSWILSVSTVLTVLTALGAAFWFNMSRRMSQIQVELSQQGERIEWLLEKGNRRDCEDGRVEDGNLICKPFCKNGVLLADSPMCLAMPKDS